MTDALGRIWCCPGVVDSTVPGEPDATVPGTVVTDPSTEPVVPPADATTPGATTPVDPTAGLWGMSPELQSLYGGILSRASGILNMPYGYDPQALAYMFGPQFEGIRKNEAATRDSLLGNLNRMGMANTGAGGALLNQNAWQTQDQIAQQKRALFGMNEQQKRMDMMNQNQLLLSLFAGGLGAENLTETLNAARRGEVQDFWNSMMQLLSVYKG